MASFRLTSDDARELAALCRLLAGRLERIENKLGGRARKRRKSAPKRKGVKAS